MKEAPPFFNVGIDFAGPLFHRSKSGEMEKCYVVLYVCCTSRAIHLDLVEDLSGPTFVRSMQRFTACRGTPDLINSDNAKTFKFTHKLLERLARDHSVVSFLQAKRITWKFCRALVYSLGLRLLENEAAEEKGRRPFCFDMRDTHCIAQRPF